ncbi:hypothetical protein COLO4_12324 [Corchorus olitorius]|uniref:Uncharacterized protein n=1 Tax=Corchorus olitorius TaxID=93759 RepID=A0A1R3K180_9ROSI|nr:hypothetical protein COLO4_12324 [Corchorus olitorius]
MAPKIRTKLMTMKASVLYFRIEEKPWTCLLGVMSFESLPLGKAVIVS